MSSQYALECSWTGLAGLPDLCNTINHHYSNVPSPNKRTFNKIILKLIGKYQNPSTFNLQEKIISQ